MKKMTLVQHFSELRRRILWVALAFLGALLVGWYVAPFVQEFLTRPLLDIWADGTLLYTGLTDGLMIRFSMATLFALVCVLPIALWQFWAFIEPALKKNERKLIWPVLVMSPILFVIGASFAFYILFPIVFKFFIELNQDASVIFQTNSRTNLTNRAKNLATSGQLRAGTTKTPTSKIIKNSDQLIPNILFNRNNHHHHWYLLFYAFVIGNNPWQNLFFPSIL